MTDLPLEDAPRTVEEWRGYLAEYGKEYVEANEDEEYSSLTAEQIESHWLGAEPAGEQTIAAQEQRLGIQFPPSLRAFLTVTDGWQGVGGWIDRISPCAEIDWMRNTGPGDSFIHLYAEGEDPEDDTISLADLFRRALLVAAGEDLWLLDPTETQPDGEWTAYEFTPKYGTVEEYPSFAELFHESKDQI
ncbi:hypothetical protein HY68_23530 [Streptomyces sp. AcH 505]|uniref:SMI1/KNR4 family protein n=1 Tax=Streptomyces sp. AcH 505 TaxID=352211 RepID=UPI000591F425|nr:hypothetical protein HY68_23530 [Streptomyces sp. AcH 505]